jgi:hypothetical protein
MQAIELKQVIVAIALCGASVASGAFGERGPVEEQISACFNRAYAALSTTKEFRDPAVGEYEVTCGQGNGLTADNKNQWFDFSLPPNYKVESVVFVSTSKTSGGWYASPTAVHNQSALRTSLGCSGHKSIKSAREWSKGYITGLLRYLPTEDERSTALSKCLQETFGNEHEP